MRSLLSRDWLPLVALAALYFIAAAVAPAVELLTGGAK